MFGVSGRCYRVALRHLWSGARPTVALHSVWARPCRAGTPPACRMVKSSGLSSMARSTSKSRLRIMWASRCRRGPRAWRPCRAAPSLRRWWAPRRAARPHVGSYGNRAISGYGSATVPPAPGSTLGFWPVWSYLAGTRQTRSHNFCQRAPPTSNSWHHPIGVCRTLTRVCSLVHGETCPACWAPTTVNDFDGLT